MDEVIDKNEIFKKEFYISLIEQCDDLFYIRKEPKFCIYIIFFIFKNEEKRLEIKKIYYENILKLNFKFHEFDSFNKFCNQYNII